MISSPGVFLDESRYQQTPLPLPLPLPTELQQLALWTDLWTDFRPVELNRKTWL